MPRVRASRADASPDDCPSEACAGDGPRPMANPGDRSHPLLACGAPSIVEAGFAAGRRR
jgi:hypothetical protein